MKLWIRDSFLRAANNLSIVLFYTNRNSMFQDSEMKKDSKTNKLTSNISTKYVVC